MRGKALLVKVPRLWPLALLALPGCLKLPVFNVNDFTPPWSGAVYCDIQALVPPHCASPEEIAIGIRLTGGAVALVNGRRSSIALDYSAASTAQCGGRPRAITFEGPFPDGTTVCLGCPHVSSRNDASSACLAWCEDLFNRGSRADDAAIASCTPRTRVSTNGVALPNFCAENGCTSEAIPLPVSFDARRQSEPVAWRDLVGVGTSGDDGNTLTRTAPTPADPQQIDAGAASAQTITSGDGYVQFTAAETDTLRLAGLSHGNPPDTNPDYTNIDFAIDLFTDGCFYVFESGTKISAPPDGLPCNAPGSFGTYAAGATFRVYALDNGDGTAQVQYSYFPAPCVDGMPCAGERIFYTSQAIAQYPLRVDVSFREQNGTLQNVRLVRVR